MNHAYLTDKDVMAILRISSKTLRAILRDGPNVACTVDLRKAGAIRVGQGKIHGQRRWPVGKFASLVGITREEIWAALA